MWNNSVIIASTAGFLVDTLRDLLKDIGFKTIIAHNDTDLTQRIKNAYPRYVFIEHCFMNNTTADYIHKIMKVHRNLHIVLWTVYELNVTAAARFIYAGAESYFSLRDNCENIEMIFKRFSIGKTYCPAEVKAVVDEEKSIPVFGKKLTYREKQIMRLIDNYDKEIAKILSISIKTVYFHKANIFSKLGLSRKRQLVNYANKHKYIINEE